MRTIFAMVLLVTSGVAVAQEEAKPKPIGVRPCVANFTEEGSFFRGKTYKTWQEYTGVDYDKAFRKVAQSVAENNWGTVNANKDLGLITASQTVIMGKGAVAPLNVM